MRTYTMKRSVFRRRWDAGWWYCAVGGGIALRGHPKRISGAWVNTPWRLFGLEWRS